ncbi:MAG: fibrobacter succinogenes major paralogous domain-containing protein [Saprospiraceae bacterium]|nr:fibrobacter succinogenes major paralogous domain-containing protein [Saprospiraceae bacterium]
MRILLTIIGLMLTTLVFSQKLEVDGDIKISSSGETSPAPGTIRWTGTDILGWNGSKWISLTSGVAFEGDVTDIDGNLYRTIKIGTQEWMAENLRTTRYTNGEMISKVNNSTTWPNANYGAWCWYDTSSTYELPYGKLYNWYAVNDGRGLCPTGWHEPTDAEWTTLTDFLGGLSLAGGPMKAAGTAHWKTPNTGATNASGFSGLPGG